MLIKLNLAIALLLALHTAKATLSALAMPDLSSVKFHSSPYHRK